MKRWPQLVAVVLTACLATPAIAGSYTLITEPADGLASIYNLIRSAKRTLDMTMYELNDLAAEQLLAQAAAAGVAVRVILDRNLEESANTPAYNYLASHGVAVHWANASYAATHQKTITADGAASAILTLNLTSQYYSSTRDFAVIDNDPSDVAAIEAVFAADFANSAVTPSVGDSLVWSPTNSGTVLLGIIDWAQYSLLVENEEMSDATIVNALAAAARRGVAVQVVMTNAGNEYASEFGQIVAAGGRVATYAPDAPLYIHAKAILADCGTPGARLFVGSQNFSAASLGENRELGLTLADPAIMQSIQATMTADFDDGALWPGSAPAAHPGFSLALCSPSLTLSVGGSKACTVTASAWGGFSSAIALTVTGLPPGVTATLTPSSIPAPGSGAVTLQLTASALAPAGAYTVSIAATGGGVTQRATLALGVAPAAVVNGASFGAGFAAGGWVTITGTNLAPVADDWSSSITEGRLPTSLEGVTVTIAGQPAYLEYVSPSQINAVAPENVSGNVLVTVNSPTGAASAMALAEMVQPAFFQWGAYAVATHLDYTYAVKNGVLSAATVAAAPGETVILWGTGLGPTDPAAPAGMETPAGTLYATANPVAVTIGNTSATVLGAALAPGFAALYQVAIQVPESLAAGDYPVVMAVAGAQSPPNVLLTIQK